MGYSDDECQRICELTHQYLHWMVYRVCGKHPEAENILNGYREPAHKPGDLSLPKIYEHFLSHAGNKSSGGNAIKKIFGSSYDDADLWKKLQELLGNFDPEYVSKFPDVAMLRQAISEIYGLTDFTGYVEQYIVTIFEIGHFFNKNRDLYEYMREPYEKDRTKLIRVLRDHKGVYRNAFFGMGDALLRDALKELGYVNYVKPDVHIRDIAENLFPELKNASDEQVAIAVEGLALNGNITPYQLDKFLFLIGSGNFNKPEHKNIKEFYKKRDSVTRKQEFAEFVLERIHSSPLQVGDKVASLVNKYEDKNLILQRGQIGQIKEVQEDLQVKIVFLDDSGQFLLAETLYPTEFIVLHGTA